MCMPAMLPLQPAVRVVRWLTSHLLVVFCDVLYIILSAPACWLLFAASRTRSAMAATSLAPGQDSWEVSRQHR
jgi:hypothetical protein